METKKIVQNQITINASAEQVWDALTNPSKTQIYMFGCEAISDWKKGSPLIWKMIQEGKDLVPVKGIILEIDPPRRLKYTVIDPFAPYPDIPENYLRVTYELEEKNGETLFTVTQDGFETAADGEKRYTEINNNGDGWNPILEEIKKVAENV